MFATLGKLSVLVQGKAKVNKKRTFKTFASEMLKRPLRKTAFFPLQR